MKNGGPAFPCEYWNPEQVSEFQRHYGGMSLRDWFAGMALPHAQKIVEKWYSINLNKEEKERAECAPVASELAYNYADAMLKEREK